MLAYKIHGDACNEYVWLGENIALKAMKKWVIAIRGCFKETYLIKPMKDDFER